MGQYLKTVHNTTIKNEVNDRYRCDKQRCKRAPNSGKCETGYCGEWGACCKNGEITSDGYCDGKNWGHHYSRWNGGSMGKCVRRADFHKAYWNERMKKLTSLFSKEEEEKEKNKKRKHNVL